MRASEQFVETYYNDDLDERESPESKWAAQWFREVKGESVLNIGCGPQLYNDALAFAETPMELVGLDANEANIEFLRKSRHPEILKAKKRLDHLDVKIELLLQDIRENNATLCGRFDTVFASGLIGSFNQPDTSEILQTLLTYLNPHGRLVIVSWADDYLSDSKLEERRRYEWYERHELAPEDVARILDEAGFWIMRQEIYRVPNPKEYEWGTIYAFLAAKK